MKGRKEGRTKGKKEEREGGSKEGRKKGIGEDGIYFRRVQSWMVGGWNGIGREGRMNEEWKEGWKRGKKEEMKV